MNILICQCRLSNDDHYTTLVKDMGLGEAISVWGTYGKSL